MSKAVSELHILKHKGALTRYWFEVVGDIDSCGHRHETRVEAAACKRLLEQSTPTQPTEA